MPDSSSTPSNVFPAPTPAGTGALLAEWRDGLAILNLRGDPCDASFRDAVNTALGLALPSGHLHTVSGPDLRIVPAGPDDWFLISPSISADALEGRLRPPLAGQPVAITEVSSGYCVLRLSGLPLREVLAQGCPLDLHPRAFGRDRCAGTHFFKLAVWLWRTDAADTIELLVRRSFVPYARLMLARTTRECGLEERSAMTAGTISRYKTD